MARRTAWETLPDVSSALQDILAHYMVLGCAMGSSRLDSLIAHVDGPPELHEQFHNAQAAFAAYPHHPEAIVGLARATWAAFCEPSAPALREIDKLGIVDGYGVPNPGAFGRLWCRRITDAAWTIWTTACLHDRAMQHIELDKEWLDNLG